MIKYKIKRGDTTPIVITYKLDDVAVDLSGYTPVLCAKSKVTDTSYLFNKSGVAATPSTSGIATITIEAADAATVCKNAIAEALLIDVTGKQYTYGQFLLDIEDDVYD